MGLLAGCSKEAPDPCEPSSWSERACEDAVRRGGYYSHGSYIPHVYPFFYPYYFGRYGTYVSNGGKVNAAPAEAYAPVISRGGFGTTGSGAVS